MTDKPDVVRPVAADVLDMLDYTRGDVVAVLGHERLRLGEREDIAAFEPVYLKEFVIRPVARRRAEKPSQKQ
jgi:hypothetical protein